MTARQPTQETDSIRDTDPSRATDPDPRAAFDRLLAEMRPRLHRYCARMAGSTVDGEDIVQDALMKAIEGFEAAGPLAQPEGWLFRIAHNAALDFLRRRARAAAATAEADLALIVDPASLAADPTHAAAGLRTFMHLPVAERSSVLLMDLMGYSLIEIGRTIDATVPAVKAALNRGRRRLRALAAAPDERPVPALPAAERARLDHYVARFNAREFDRLRDMLAEDVRLDLVARAELRGRHEVGGYFGRYAAIADWQLLPGWADGRPALLVRDPRDPAAGPRYFILLAWTGERIAQIRDFRYAPYAMDGADLRPAG